MLKRFKDLVHYMFNEHKAGLYYVSYIQDAGYGAAMLCHHVFYATSLKDARENWQQRLREFGFAVQPAYGEDPEELFYVDERLQKYTIEELLDYYDPPTKCSFVNDAGLCSVSTCTKGALEYGCYQTAHEAWVERWRFML